MPVKVEDAYYIQSESQELNEAIQAWYMQHERRQNGEITEKEYSEWKDEYTPGNPDQPEGTSESPDDAVPYRDDDLRVAMRTVLQHILWIYRDRMELIIGSIEEGKDELALSHVEPLSQTLETIIN